MKSSNDILKDLNAGPVATTYTPTYATINVREGPGASRNYVRIWSAIHVYTRRPPNTQTSIHRNLIGPSINAPPSMLSPSSILQSHSSHRAFSPARKNSSSVGKVLYIFFLTVLSSILIL
jgi:hypothetical protein